MISSWKDLWEWVLTAAAEEVWLLCCVAPVLQTMPAVITHICKRRHIHTSPLFSHIKIIGTKPVWHIAGWHAFPILNKQTAPTVPFSLSLQLPLTSAEGDKYFLWVEIWSDCKFGVYKAGLFDLNTHSCMLDTPSPLPSSPSCLEGGTEISGNKP